VLEHLARAEALVGLVVAALEVVEHAVRFQVEVEGQRGPVEAQEGEPQPALARRPGGDEAVEALAPRANRQRRPGAPLPAGGLDPDRLVEKLVEALSSVVHVDRELALLLEPAPAPTHVPAVVPAQARLVVLPGPLDLQVGRAHEHARGRPIARVTGARVQVGKRDLVGQEAELQPVRAGPEQHAREVVGRLGVLCERGERRGVPVGRREQRLAEAHQWDERDGLFGLAQDPDLEVHRAAEARRQSPGARGRPRPEGGDPRGDPLGTHPRRRPDAVDQLPPLGCHGFDVAVHVEDHRPMVAARHPAIRDLRHRCSTSWRCAGRRFGMYGSRSSRRGRSCSIYSHRRSQRRLAILVDSKRSTVRWERV
jgi:hypothetical protein